MSAGIIGGADGPTAIFLSGDVNPVIFVIRIVISLLYAGLCIFAVIMEFRKTKRLDYVMLIGAVMLASANFLSGAALPLVCAAAGLLIIHAAALMNGKRNGKINVSHHAIRLVFSISIFLLFLFS